MKIATQRLLRHISQPLLNATILHSTTKTSLCFKPSYKHFCVVSLRSNRMYFSTGKDVAVEELNESLENQDSNLSTYIKNTKTIEILQKKGIKSLFPIQVETFQAVYSGRDLLASDRTGSGKTIAYSLPILQKLRDQRIFKSGKKQVKFLIMCPTRELTLQVYKQISSLKHNSNDFNVVAVYGGASIDDQVRELRNGVDVIVATPGRLMDLVERRILNFSELQATCIDEADQMLEKGFKLDIEEIFSLIQKQREQKTQNMMFSATIPDWVDKISSQYMEKSKKKTNLISKSQTQTSITVEHLAIECPFKDRVKCIQALIKAYNSNEELSTIIFAERKLQVTEIAMEFGKSAAFLQGDMDQKERQLNLNAFRNGKRKILVATDVASRGLDIDNVGLVIQLEPPRNTQPFIHRAGRTGRAGRKGICITLFDKKKHLSSMVRIQNEAKIIFRHISHPQIHQSQTEWENKFNSIPQTLKSIKKDAIAHEKLDRMADLLISSHSDVKELVKRQLVAIVGEPPVHISLTSQEKGYKTHVIQMKEADTIISTMDILSFIKTNFAVVKVANVHVQSSNIIFDIHEDSLADFNQVLKSNTIKQSPYDVREATVKDRQMTSLKEMARSEIGRAFTDRGDFRREFRNDRRGEQNIEQKSGTVFIPRLPSQIQEKDLLYKLDEMNIQYDSARLKRKNEQNVFAFVQISDQLSFMQLIEKGIKFNGQKFRAFASQTRESSRSFSGNQSNSFERSSAFSGSERRDNYNKTSQGRSKRSRRDEDEDDY